MTRFHFVDVVDVALLLTLLMCLSGCCILAKHPVPQPPKHTCYLLDGIPSYPTLSKKYNQNIDKIDKLRARSDIEITWYDEDGRHFESGSDSLVMFWRPDRFAVSIGKLGKDFFWAGFDQDRYWLFQNFKDKLAFVGRHENYHRKGTKRMPIPVGPENWPAMMGLVPLDAASDIDYRVWPKPQLVKSMAGQCHLMVTYPGRPIRLFINPTTYLPDVVEFLNGHGETWMRSELHHFIPVDQTMFDEMTGDEIKPTGKPPMIASTIKVTWSQSQDLLEIKLFKPSNRRLRNRQFDFDALKDIFEPRTLVDLDDETLTVDRMKQFKIQSSGTDGRQRAPGPAVTDTVEATEMQGL